MSWGSFCESDLFKAGWLAPEFQSETAELEKACGLRKIARKQSASADILRSEPISRSLTSV